LSRRLAGLGLLTGGALPTGTAGLLFGLGPANGFAAGFLASFTVSTRVRRGFSADFSALAGFFFTAAFAAFGLDSVRTVFATGWGFALALALALALAFALTFAFPTTLVVDSLAFAFPTTLVVDGLALAALAAFGFFGLKRSSSAAFIAGVTLLMWLLAEIPAFLSISSALSLVILCFLASSWILIDIPIPEHNAFYW
jgi:hypothetical protein